MVIALIVLGPAKLPEMVRTVGKGIREFKGGMAGLTGLGDLGGATVTARVNRTTTPGERLV